MEKTYLGRGLRLCGRADGLADGTYLAGRAVLDVYGQDDKIGLVQHQKLESQVYCTPRCHITRSWEVGLYNGYLFYLLVGRNQLTSFDFHVCQTIEIIQVFFHALEIQEQSGPRIFLYGSFCQLKTGRAKNSPAFMQNSDSETLLSRSLGVLVMDLKNYLHSATTGHSATGLLQSLENLQSDYFRTLHLASSESERMQRRLFLRRLGYLHSLVQRRCAEMNLVIRRYFCETGSHLLVSFHSVVATSNHTFLGRFNL